MTTTVKLIRPFGCFRQSCSACWNSFKPQREIAGELYRDGEQVGLICDQCLDAGEEELRIRMKECADDLIRYAQALRKSAAGEIVVPTSAEVAHRDEEERAAWEKEYGNRETPPDHLSNVIPF